MLTQKHADFAKVKKQKTNKKTPGMVHSQQPNLCFLFALWLPQQTVSAYFVFIVRINWIDYASTLASDTLCKNIKFDSVFIACTKLYKIDVERGKAHLITGMEGTTISLGLSYSVQQVNVLILKNIYMGIVLGITSYGPFTILPIRTVFALFF